MDLAPAPRPLGATVHGERFDESSLAKGIRTPGSIAPIDPPRGSAPIPTRPWPAGPGARMFARGPVHLWIDLPDRRAASADERLAEVRRGDIVAKIRRARAAEARLNQNLGLKALKLFGCSPKMDPLEPAFRPSKGAEQPAFDVKTVESDAKSRFGASRFGRGRRISKSSNRGRFVARSASRPTRKGGAAAPPVVHSRQTA